MSNPNPNPQPTLPLADQAKRAQRREVIGNVATGLFGLLLVVLFWTMPYRALMTLVLVSGLVGWGYFSSTISQRLRLSPFDQALTLFGGLFLIFFGLLSAAVALGVVR